MTYRGIVATKRRTIWRRDGGQCHYCTATFAEDDAYTVDHVWPRGLGGSNRNDNLVLCCLTCNHELDFCVAAVVVQMALVTLEAA